MQRALKLFIFVLETEAQVAKAGLKTHCQGQIWTSDPPISASHVLGLQGRDNVPGSFSAQIKLTDFCMLGKGSTDGEALLTNYL